MEPRLEELREWFLKNAKRAREKKKVTLRQERKMYYMAEAKAWETAAGYIKREMNRVANV